MVRIVTLNTFKSFACIQVAALLITLSVVNLPLVAQLTSGNITGVVYDPSGATVANAQVIAHNDATGQENTTTSTGAGDYRFENLPVGTYTITVNAAGFTKSEVKGVNVELNVTVTRNVTVQVGRSATTVEVAESAVAIDTTTAQIQTTFNTKEIT